MNVNRDTTSTQIVSAYYGNTFADSELAQREKKLTEDLIKICDRIITMGCAPMKGICSMSDK
jgi:protein-tyrosine-phosphatase